MKYTRRPTKVIILNQTFKVEWVTAADESHGFVDLNKCVIQMAKGYPKETTADTFLHEVIHAVNHVMDVGDKTTEEEATKPIRRGFIPNENILLILVCKPRATIANKIK